MLGKMLIHGLVAAALVGGAAAVYAQARDTGYLSPGTAPAASQTKETADALPGDRNARPAFDNFRSRDDDRRHERKYDRRSHHDRHHDDD